MKKIQILSKKQSLKKLSEFKSQPQVVKIFKNLISGGRVHHAYLFSGGNSLEKLEFVRSITAFLNCEKPQNDEFCGICKSCELLENSAHPGFILITGEKDNSIIGIDQIRELGGIVKYGAPWGIKWQVVLINRAEDLTEEAQNSFLKILEEPPKNILFILINDNPFLLKETILSRCHKINFNFFFDSKKLDLEKDFSLNEILNIFREFFGLELLKNIEKVLPDFLKVVLSFDKIPLSRLLEISESFSNYPDQLKLRENLIQFLNAIIFLLNEKVKFFYIKKRYNEGKILKSRIKFLIQAFAELTYNVNILGTMDFLLLRLADYV